jgi:hypothetical protein
MEGMAEELLLLYHQCLPSVQLLTLLFLDGLRTRMCIRVHHARRSIMRMGETNGYPCRQRLHSPARASFFSPCAYLDRSDFLESARTTFSVLNEAAFVLGKFLVQQHSMAAA